MRIPNTAEFFAFFAATGQLSGLSRMPTAELSLLDEPFCDRTYTVRDHDTCDTIGASHHAPTYQIICENSQIDGKCTDLRINENICLGRIIGDCRDVYSTISPYTDAVSISKRFGIDLKVFEANNYCFNSGPGEKCPSFGEDTVVCIAKERIGNLPKCDKLFPK